MSIKYTNIFTVLLIFVSGVLAGWFFLSPNQKTDQIKLSETEKNEQKQTQKQYPLLSKRIFAENQNDILINFIPLRTALREYVENQEEEIGVYFEYLPAGVSIGINDTLETNIASLIKIPLVMGVYREIEKGKIKKDNTLTITKENIDRRFGDFWKNGSGTQITLSEAINLALIKSDNTAANMLLSVVPEMALDNVFDSLDIPKDKKDKYHIISPKSYSSILRSLYLSSYLNQDSSSEILDIMTKTDFNDKIAAGVPPSIKVAHKIGVFNSADNPEETYSDCGIVYVPNRPYLLCIMAKSTEEKSREYMSHISKMIYGYVTMVKGNE